MMNKADRFGDKLRALRKNRDITIQQMHLDTGFARSTVRKWEKGIAYPSSYQVITLLANYFQVSPDYFFEQDSENGDPVIQDILTRVQRLENEMRTIARRDSDGESTTRLR